MVFVYNYSCFGEGRFTSYDLLLNSVRFHLILTDRAHKPNDNRFMHFCFFERSIKEVFI